MNVVNARGRVCSEGGLVVTSGMRYMGSATHDDNGRTLLLHTVPLVGCSMTPHLAHVLCTFTCLMPAACIDILCPDVMSS